jgi:hypothetical protein
MPETKAELFARLRAAPNDGADLNDVEKLLRGCFDAGVRDIQRWAGGQLVFIPGDRPHHDGYELIKAARGAILALLPDETPSGL